MSANTKEYLRDLMEDIVQVTEIRERMPDVLVYPALRGQRMAVRRKAGGGMTPGRRCVRSVDRME